ncbi:MAG: (deoxy)nucleoside triphosphate pyrophosphohydrolase [Clostridia bacterium]|nr:(deoxy)nucleoside triphosphate pyrophosphohydrolase [Clostridia bacterium]
MIEVVAALIWSGKKFLICQRPKHKTRGLMWEFVGGKVELGEEKEQALVRECREELGVTLSVGEQFMRVVHQYPDMLIGLTLFNATIKSGEIQLLEHADVRWIEPKEIDFYDFCPADVEILAKIKQKYC